MSNKHPVSLRSQVDPYLDSAIVPLILEIVQGLQGNPNVFRKFLFSEVTAHNFPDSPPFDYNVLDMYQAYVSAPRTCTPTESRLCEVLQSMIDSRDDCRGIKKALASILEYYHYNERVKLYGHGVWRNARLAVNGTVVEYRKCKEIDIGVDRLDDLDRLELAECASNMHLVLNGEKTPQLEFYAHGLEQIRDVVGASSQLVLTLIFAYGGERQMRRRLRRDALLWNGSQRLIQNHITVIAHSTAEQNTQIVD
jgi:hypothetical protein